MQYIQFVTYRCLCLFLFLLTTPTVSASDNLLRPLAIKNLNPFIGVYGISAMQSTVVLAPDRHAFSAIFDAVSHFTDARRQSEFIRIDGETYRLALRYSRGMQNRWEIGTEVPLLSHRGGVMDGFISNWHDFFGLPSLGRDRVVDNQLQFLYSRDGLTQINVQSSTTGLGDILLFAGKTVRREDDHSVTVRGQLKLPTGDANRLMGSGGIDISLSATAAHKWGKTWLGSIRLGGSYLETGDVLPQLQRNWVGFGSAYLGWRPFDALAFKLQLDVQTSIYKDSDIDQLTEPAFQLSVGGSVGISKSTFLDLSVTEDEINPDVSSDVSFQLRLRRTH